MFEFQVCVRGILSGMQCQAVETGDRSCDSELAAPGVRVRVLRVGSGLAGVVRGLESHTSTP